MKSYLKKFFSTKAWRLVVWLVVFGCLTIFLASRNLPGEPQWSVPRMEKVETIQEYTVTLTKQQIDKRDVAATPISADAKELLRYYRARLRGRAASLFPKDKKFREKLKLSDSQLREIRKQAEAIETAGQRELLKLEVLICVNLITWLRKHGGEDKTQTVVREQLANYKAYYDTATAAEDDRIWKKILLTEEKKGGLHFTLFDIERSWVDARFGEGHSKAEGFDKAWAFNWIQIQSLSVTTCDESQAGLAKRKRVLQLMATLIRRFKDLGKKDNVEELKKLIDKSQSEVLRLTRGGAFKNFLRRILPNFLFVNVPQEAMKKMKAKYLQLVKAALLSLDHGLLNDFESFVQKKIANPAFDPGEDKSFQKFVSRLQSNLDAFYSKWSGNANKILAEDRVTLTRGKTTWKAKADTKVRAKFAYAFLDGKDLVRTIKINSPFRSLHPHGGYETDGGGCKVYWRCRDSAWWQNRPKTKSATESGLLIAYVLGGSVVTYLGLGLCFGLIQIFFLAFLGGYSKSLDGLWKKTNRSRTVFLLVNLTVMALFLLAAL